MEKADRNLSILIIARNERKNIERCIKSAEGAGKILVLDNRSDDGTGKIAEKTGAEVYSYYSDNFSEMRNFLLTKAGTDWVFYLDADEQMTTELISEIKQIAGSDDTLYSAYTVARKTYYFGNYLWPMADRVERLFRRADLTGWTGAVHESPRIKGKTANLKSHLIHHTHRDLTSMTAKTNSWSTIESRLRFEKGHPDIVWWRLLRVMWSGFTDSYFRKRGYLAGNIGLIESIFQSFSMFITYAKLWEYQNKDYHKS